MNQDFVDLLRALSEADARFLVVGAYAVAVHGHPRATGDLDVWVEAADENAARVYRALLHFGAPLSELSVEDLAMPGVVFQMGLPPRRIDILTSITAVEFSDAWSERLDAELGGVRCSVIGIRHLVANKLATGRTKDLADAEALELIRKDSAG
jgi:hypothetical protein